MNLREVAPDSLAISDMNERTMSPLTDDLAESIKQQGVVQPPIVRENGDGLEVVVGQRRTLAAREVDLPTIPVVVMDWNDASALEASITENIKAFRENVSDNERGAAVTRLMELHGETQPEVAERLGVDGQTVADWLEGSREEWEGTDVEPEFKRRKTNPSGSGNDNDIYTAADESAEELSAAVGGSTLRSIRSATGGGTEGEEMAHRVAKGELSRSDVRDIARNAAGGADDDDDDADTSSTTDERTERSPRTDDTAPKPSGSIGVQLTLPNEIGETLESRAEADGVSNEEIVRRALRQYLGVNS